MQLAYRLVRTGVPGSQLASAVRRAKLDLGETPPFCDRLTLCDQGVVLGSGTVIAPLVELPGGRFGLKVEGRAEEILALLSIARGAPDSDQRPRSLEQRLSGPAARRQSSCGRSGWLSSVSPPCPDGRRRWRSPRQPPRCRRALNRGASIKALGIAAPVEKASPDDPKHPGWPKGDRTGAAGNSVPRRRTITPVGPPDGKPRSGRQMTEALARGIKSAVRGLLARAESAPDPRVKIAALLLGGRARSLPLRKRLFRSAEVAGRVASGGAIAQRGRLR